MIVSKTEAGQQVIKDRSVALTPRQRSALILVDGRRTLEQWRADATAAGAAPEDLDRLFELGLLASSGAPAAAAAAPVAASPASAPAAATSPREGAGRSPQERYAQAYPIATKLTAGLGLRGFRLNLAVEAAGSYDALRELAPKIREAVGADKYGPLDDALND